MKALVTGGAGFIGRRLVERLINDGHAAVVLDDLSSGDRDALHPAARLVHDTVLNVEVVRREVEQADAVFHLAAIASVEVCVRDLLGAHEVNGAGFLVVLEALARAGARPFVYASSAAVYGDLAEPAREDGPARPLSPYGADKLSQELHAAAAAHVYGLGSTGLRFFNVYGPGQDPRSPYSGVISIFADRLASDLVLDLHGDGAQVRDFVYVDDVVEALIRAAGAQGPGSGVLNVCTGHGASIGQLAVTLAEVLGRTPRLRRQSARSGDIRHSVGDPTLLQQTLGFRAATPLAAGLSRLVAATNGFSAS